MVLVEQQARHEIRPPLVFPLEARLILQQHDDLPVRLDDGRSSAGTRGPAEEAARADRAPPARLDEAGEADEVAAFAVPAAVRPDATAGVAPAPGLADALAAGGDGERPQPLRHARRRPRGPATAAMAGTEPSACLKRAFANRRFIRDDSHRPRRDECLSHLNRHAQPAHHRAHRAAGIATTVRGRRGRAAAPRARRCRPRAPALRRARSVRARRLRPRRSKRPRAMRSAIVRASIAGASAARRSPRVRMRFGRSDSRISSPARL